VLKVIKELRVLMVLRANKDLKVRQGHRALKVIKELKVL
jgi:hypothetical protein